jgi:hypothetical protein
MHIETIQETVSSFGICPLCNQTGELQLSHILPASAHRITKTAGRNVLTSFYKNVVDEKNQSDFKEKLLCFSCEQALSVIEGFAIQACRGAWPHRKRPFYEIPEQAVHSLVAFAYSVFWRSSISKRFAAYNLGPDIERELKEAFWNKQFPSPPYLSVSMSFLMSKYPLTERALFTPWVSELPAGIQVHYFSIFGLVFRLHIPNALYEVEANEILRAENGTGRIYHLLQWEKENIDSAITNALAMPKLRPR